MKVKFLFFFITFVFLFLSFPVPPVSSEYGEGVCQWNGWRGLGSSCTPTGNTTCNPPNILVIYDCWFADSLAKCNAARWYCSPANSACSFDTTQNKCLNNTLPCPPGKIPITNCSSYTSQFSCENSGAAFGCKTVTPTVTPKPPATPTTSFLHPTGFWGELEQIAIPKMAGKTIGDVINAAMPIVFTLGGILMLLFLIYSGYQWMISQNDPKALQIARTNLTYAIIGFLVIFISYWIITALAQMLDLRSVKTLFGI